MDRSRGAARTRVTLPTPRVEPVESPTGRELEVKFKTDAAGLKLALRSELLAIETADAPRRTLRSVYFDTSAGDLRKQRMVLRVRKVRNTHIMGLKGARPLADVPFSRSQMEACVPSLDPDITLFGEEIAAELSRVIEGHLLEQKFETQIKRRLRCLNLERSQIEVAFDEGFVVARDRRQPLTEIELELKSGEETAL
jgi:inorganic triphosphatase YgiF